MVVLTSNDGFIAVHRASGVGGGFLHLRIVAAEGNPHTIPDESNPNSLGSTGNILDKNRLLAHGLRRIRKDST
jgi:hypothetical protein